MSNPSITKIADQLYLGDSKSSRDRRILEEHDITAVIAYLMLTYQYDLATALAFVGGKRRIKRNENFREQLEVWGAVGGNVWAARGVLKPEYAVYLVKRTERLQEAGLKGNEPVCVRFL